MSTYSHGIIAAGLHSKFGNIDQAESDQTFFMKIADYGKYLFENELTRAVLLPLQVQEHEMRLLRKNTKIKGKV